MKNTLPFCARKYILPTTIRRFYKVSGLSTIVGLLGFALFMLAVGANQDTDKMSCFAVAAIFGILFIGYLIIWSKNYLLVNATYYADSSVVMNCVDRQNVKVVVDLYSAIPIAYTHTFYVGKGSFSVEYIIFSPNAFLTSTASEFEGLGIYKILKRIWMSGSVIIPAQKDDSVILCDM